MENRSLIAYEHYRDAAQRFDYLVTGLIGALCAYIGQNIHPQKIGITPNTLELVSFLIFVFAFLFCFKRLEKSIQVFNIGHQILDLGEKKGQLIPHIGKTQILNESTGDIFSAEEVCKRIKAFDKEIPVLEKNLEKVRKQSKCYYDLRNWAIFVGFISLLASKIWSAYI